MTNKSNNDTQWLSDYDYDNENLSFEDLESKLEAELEEQMKELNGLEHDAEKIGNPDTLGETVMNVVWEQFINQIGVVAGEEFIKENRGLTLDLRDSAHIQTPDNFAQGKIATHNHISREQLEKNYDRYKNMPHKEFRDKYVDPGMDATLPRAGKLKSQGIDTVKDIYTGRQIPTETKLPDGSNNPNAAQREHVKPSANNYENPSLQMAYGNEELADIINAPENLQGYTTAKRNQDKSNKTPDEMDASDKTKHWEKANEKAEKHIKKKEQEGEQRLKKEGRKTQMEEATRMGKKALQAAFMGMLASLMKDVIRKLIQWFRSGERKLKTFLKSIKEAITSFFSNIKEHLLTALDTSVTSIATAICGPIVNLIKKAWIFLKQGYNSIKQAVNFLRNPDNKNMPFSLKLMEVGKIVIVGITAGGSILLSEVIEKSLMSIPGFSFEIPLLGSLANLLGMFLGGLVSGLIGALALNLIDRLISKKLKKINQSQQIDVRNKILDKQTTLINIVEQEVNETREETIHKIKERHKAAAEQMHAAKEEILKNQEEIDAPPITDAEIVDNSQENLQSENESSFNQINNILKDIKDYGK